MEESWKNKKFIYALKNSLNGIKHVFKFERNLKFELIIAIIVIIFAFLFKFNAVEFSILSITIFLVIFAEFINTSIESVVDLYTSKYNEHAKIAKDVSAGAVLIVSLNSVIIGITLFGIKIINLI